MPVSSYAPEYLELFKAGAEKKITVQLPSKQKAVQMRQRLHTLRKEMRKENHPLTTIANSTQVSIGNDGTLSVYPADTSFLAAIHAAGIRPPESPNSLGAFAGPEVPSPQTPAPTTGEPAQEVVDVLSQFFGPVKEN